MSYRCLIVDDEELARELIESHLGLLDDFELVASCASALEAHRILQKEEVDLIFMDIEMPILKGTDFVKSLKQKPKVIFTTAYREYALDGFELDAVDYLLKPIVFGRFFKAIEKFLAQQKSEDLPAQKESIYLQINRKNIRVVLSEILYVESLKDYIKIYLVDETLVLKHGLTAFEKKLTPKFIRVHRSFIVNAERITAFTKNDIEIGKLEIPIGEHFKKETLERLQRS